MSYTVDTELDLSPETDQKYIVSSAHRRKQKDKSRWTVSLDVEVQCFIQCQRAPWVEDTTGWGIIPNGNSLIELGVNCINEKLKIAKFVDSASTGLWHGYPADYMRKAQDRPGMLTLQAWLRNGHIQKHHLTKIRQGKTCNL